MAHGCVCGRDYGTRVSELLALKWEDVDFATGEIRLSRGVVRQHIGKMKTEASRKPLPLDAGLADVLTRWRDAVRTIRTRTSSSAARTKTESNRTGPPPRWKSTSGPPQRGQESRSGSAGTRCVTPSALGEEPGADVATTQALLRHANPALRWIGMSKP